MIERYLLFFVCLLTIHQASSQTLLVLDDKGPIVNASVKVLDLDKGGETFYISDNHGKVRISQPSPFQVTINHLNFHTLKDTVRKSGTHKIELVKKEQTLDEVVITGQFLPQSVQNSVYSVHIIDQARLASQGARSLTEVLGSELNFRFQRDNAVGSSTASLQGISGQYIKILLDGVPIVGRGGVSNEIDLNQINLNSIEKVEVIEGPMAVNFGADALAGVINIITKKPNAHKWSVDVSLQEETVGKEYKLFDEGIHNASLSSSYSFHPNWSIQSETRYQKFGGWSGTGRDKLWYPKSQFFQSGELRYEKNDFNIYYRFDYLNETIENQGTPEYVGDEDDPYAFDKEYLTQRWMHQIQAEYGLSHGSLNTVLSFTDYDRITHRFKSYLLPGVPDLTTTTGQDTIAFRTFFFRNTLNDILQWSVGSTDWHTQIGIDGDFENAKGTTLSEGDKQMTNLGFFASTEILLGNRLKLRPGVRLSYNDAFSTKPSASINMKYNLSDRSQIRMSYGRGFRAPSLRELYHEFIDSNHNILGNPNLKPEYSDNVTGDFTHQFKNQTWRLSIKGFYNAIHNRISYFTPDGSNQTTTYINILKYKTLGTTGHVTFEKGRIQLKTGLSYIGRYHNFSENTTGLDIPQFLYSPEYIANLQYDLFNTGIALASFYKFTGSIKQYVAATDENGSSIPELRQLDGYHLWDLTLSGGLVKSLRISVGAKNLLNVTAVSNNTNIGGSHTGSNTGQSSIAYGRSYFIKFNYNFSK
ncbi:MAG: TonB-dependent receptor [Reichenbachiella sp.]|uniref:TonB-dependent receptor plug domain-containing protein n=1 Tax=Reichenbachiella sp. TaxID=2184521 RepID=UPI0032645F1B